MNKRGIHISKTHDEKITYQQIIRSLNNEPTIDEQFDFKSTIQGGEELAETPNLKRRSTKINFQQILLENWIAWAIGAVATGTFITIGFFIYDARIFDAEVKIKIETHKEKLESLNKEIENNKTKIGTNNIKIEKTSLNLNNLQQNLYEIKQDIREIRSKK
ncbi:MAG: hypothetical protein PHV82_03100 [Victivallaceae bacterium]|nr:hypothetical protein [Victivallaceae bacterium]